MIKICYKNYLPLFHSRQKQFVILCKLKQVKFTSVEICFLCTNYDFCCTRWGTMTKCTPKSANNLGIRTILSTCSVQARISGIAVSNFVRSKLATVCCLAIVSTRFTQAMRETSSGSRSSKYGQMVSYV